jgi:hypothetical protein
LNNDDDSTHKKKKKKRHAQELSDGLNELTESIVKKIKREILSGNEKTHKKSKKK